ncbi:MAG: tetratricopeptide repeat protein [Planctomycetota bacterium]
MHDDETTRPADDPTRPARDLERTTQVTPSPTPGGGVRGLRGRRIGDYELERELGSGGQGYVYLARHLRLGRAVALKLLPEVHALSPQARLRFEREAEVASRLDHPGICTVYELGEDEGVPFIAMRYVEGEPLDRKIRAAREARAADASSSRGLTLSGTDGGSTEREAQRSCLAFAREAALALHEAHESGLVHRDVKPANIMVDREGRPVLLDFGLAHDDTSDGGLVVTRTGDVLGTPAYMSPEQIRGQRLDRRTDVYSLGVTLFECLSMRRPFEAATRDALHRAITQDEPPLLGRVLPRVDRDLEVVIATALARNRDERYATAREFADEIGRVLADEPILARPAGPLKRLGRWTRRHPQLAALALVLAITLPTIAVLLTTYLNDRPRVEAARRAQIEVERDRLLSSASFELAEGSPREALRLYREAADIEGDSAEAEAGVVMALIRSRDADGALRALEARAEVLGRGAASILLRADALRIRGDAEAAAELERGAPAPADAFDHLVLAERALGAGERGEPGGFERALAHVTRAILLADGPRLLHFELRAHVAGHLRDADAIEETVEALEHRWPGAARAHRWAGFALERLPGGTERALEAYRRGVACDPRNAGIRDAYAFALQATGRLEEALVQNDAALVLLPDNPSLLHTRGVVLDGLGRAEEAEAAQRRAIVRDPGFAKAHNALGILMRKAKRYDEARTEIREAIALDPRLAPPHHNLALVDYEQGRLDDADANLAEALRLDPTLARSHYLLGMVRRAQGRLDDAIAAYREAIRLEPGMALAWNNLGGVFWDQRKAAEAAEAYERAVAADPSLAGPRVNLGRALFRLGKLDEADAAFAEALRLDAGMPLLHFDLASLRKAQRRPEEAAACYREAIRLDPEFAEAHCNLASLLIDAGDVEAAIDHYRRGHAAGSRRRTWRYPSAVWLAATLARSAKPLLDAGDTEAAIERLEEAARVTERKDPLTLFRLGLARHQAGDRGGAEGEARAALELLDGKDREEIRVRDVESFLAGLE